MEWSFEWDEEARQRVWKDRRVDLLYTALIFENPVLVQRDDRREYGKERFVALGHVDGEFFMLVYSPRSETVLRLITAWKAGKNGEKQYRDRIAR